MSLTSQKAWLFRTIWGEDSVNKYIYMGFYFVAECFHSIIKYPENNFLGILLSMERMKN